MGLLTEGKTLTWDEAAPYRAYVLEHGITQFLNVYRRFKGRARDTLLWGDEIEYIVLLLNPETKRATLSLRGKEIMVEANKETGGKFIFHPEYGRFMVESTPGGPYTGALEEYVNIELNMHARREFMQAVCNPNEYVITFTAYPRMGVGAFTTPAHPNYGPAAASHFTPDEAINAHPRFPALTQNIRLRRGSKVAINVPLFRDTHTKAPRFLEEAQFLEEVIEDEHGARTASGIPLTPLPPDAEPFSIYMDSMCFGMGCCCLQTTFQASSLDEARLLYDQLTVLCPVMMSMSAGAAIFRGLLADVDCRWNVIAGSVDDRTEEERGLKPLDKSRFHLPKSRYGSVSNYISNSELFKDSYNDLDAPFNPEVYKRLQEEGGLDSRLARHVAHLYTRDPLVIMEGIISEVDDEESSVHFENIQSTNWQTMRFKPPTPGSPIGWRVEFRPCEVQLTDFENAAYAVFIALLTRIILTYRLNFYIPLSKVDANVARAQRRDAVRIEKFFFRKHVMPTSEEEKGKGAATDDEVTELTCDEIMNGTDTFPGLLPLMGNYLDSLPCAVETRQHINRYLDLLRLRSSGRLLTAAQWVRKFVHGHAAYKHDSVVTEEINYDLMSTVTQIGLGKLKVPELLGELYPVGDQPIRHV